MHTKEAEARARIAATDTTKLVEMLHLVAQSERPEERLVRAWIIDGLSERYPDADAAVEIAFDSAQLALMETGVEPEVDYVAVLLANIPGVTA